jgi:hypothetical protein
MVSTPESAAVQGEPQEKYPFLSFGHKTGEVYHFQPLVGREYAVAGVKMRAIAQSSQSHQWQDAL